MKKIVISCGPIPAKLDSVKIVTNIFKGGLALKTAEYLYENFTNVTILKDKSTKYENKDNINVIETDGVLDYFDWFQKNANNYDVFIMAGAVSNLMPSKPYKNKFPSHNYKVGESFDIPFEIAPRAIDIIKKANPYCCLIGYKLFDAKDDEELIKIATHVLHDSKANIIIANTPKDAKNRKIILTQDGASIPMSFDEHLKFINKTIRAEYFKTNIVNISDEEREFLEPYVAMVKYYESQYCKNHGTIAIKIEKDDFTGMVTTSRGHFWEPVFVSDVNFESRTIYSTGKATLNAPLLFKILEHNQDIIFHQHKMIEKAKVVEYEFPGTKQEVELSTHLEPVEHLGRVECLNVENHGCIIAKKFENVDWNNYYQQFPNKYFTYPSEIDVEIEKFKGRETLEIGGNCRVSTKYSYDPYVKHNKAINLVDLPHLKTLKYDLIVLKNSINYISEEFLDLLISLLNKNGKIIGNTFNGYGDKKWKITDNEVTVNRGDMIDHYLILEDSIVKHSFYNRDKEFYLKKGFAVTPYNNNSLLLNYENQS